MAPCVGGGARAVILPMPGTLATARVKSGTVFMGNRAVIHGETTYDENGRPNPRFCVGHLTEHDVVLVVQSIVDLGGQQLLVLNACAQLGWVFAYQLRSLVTAPGTPTNP